MKNLKYVIKVRIGVIINLFSAICIGMIWEYCNWFNYIGNIRLLCLFPLVTLFLSFVFVYWRTGFWQFSHKSINKLDERELQFMSATLRTSYSVFTIFLLLILLFFSVFEKSLSIISVVLLIYMAHIIPTSIIAWKERVFE